MRGDLERSSRAEASSESLRCLDQITSWARGISARSLLPSACDPTTDPHSHLILLVQPTHFPGHLLTSTHF